MRATFLALLRASRAWLAERRAIRGHVGAVFDRPARPRVVVDRMTEAEARRLALHQAFARRARREAVAS